MVCGSAPAHVIPFNLAGFAVAYVVTTFTTLGTSHIRLDSVGVLVLVLVFDSLIHLVVPALWFIPEFVACIRVVGSVWSAKIAFETALFAPIPIPFDIIITVVRISTVPIFLHVGILHRRWGNRYEYYRCSPETAQSRLGIDVALTYAS